MVKAFFDHYVGKPDEKLEEPLGQLQTEKVAQDARDRREAERQRRDGNR